MDSYSTLLGKMLFLLHQMSIETEKYTLVFKQEDFFTFSDIKKRRDIYKKEYLNFICKINQLYTSFEDCTTSLSSYLLEADRDADEEKIAFFNSIFDKCLFLEKELDIFTTKTEQELSKNAVSVSVTSDCANRFLLATKTFCDFLTQV